jgi:hypothetical protein
MESGLADVIAYADDTVLITTTDKVEDTFKLFSLAAAKVKMKINIKADGSKTALMFTALNKRKLTTNNNKRLLGEF